MTYPFFSAGMNILGQTPKQDYTSLFQETINQQFANASNIFTIQEEDSFASGTYRDVDVRIMGLINPTTGDNIEDDIKKITFKNISHSVDLGRMYYFDSNYWITVNVDKIKTLAQSVVVKRCNNVLRWIDELTGAYYEVPCSLGYLINENRDYATAGSAVVTPSGMINCIVQFNSATTKIQPNQRFLFGTVGQWTAFKVEGGGIGNFLNTRTVENNTVGFTRLTLAVDYVSPVNGEIDNLTLGIANAFTNVYQLTLDKTSISGDISQTVQLYASLTLNGKTVSRNLYWTSSDTDIATVNQTGLVSFVSQGTCTIRCELENNSTVYDTVSVAVGATPVDTYQVVLTPDENFVLEGLTKTWTVYLYKNNVQQGDAFVFSLNSGTIPSANYVYTVLGSNSYKIENKKMYLTDVLTVTATSGSYVGTFEISLKGAW